MPHICLVGGSFSLSGGTERAASNLSREAVKHGYTVTLISLFGLDSLFFDFGSPISHFILLPYVNSAGINIFKCWYMLYEYFKNQDVDFVVAVESTVSLYTMLPCALARKKHINWEHFNFLVTLRRPQRFLARLLALYFSDYTVVLTEQDRRIWASFPFFRTILLSIPNCVDPEFLAHYPHKISSKTILAVGRLVPQKGFDILLNAFALVLRQSPDWTLVIVGSGKLKNKLLHQIEKLDLSGRVKLRESTGDIARFYRESSIFCLSSRFEGFGLVLIEAMASGMAAVAFDCMAGPREILRGTKSVLVRRTRSHKSLAYGLIELIKNPDLLESSRQSNIEKARQYGIEPIFRIWKSCIFEA